MLDSETAQKRQIMFGDLEKEQEKLNSEVENLRPFEREYRSRLQELLQPAAGAPQQRTRRARRPARSSRQPKRLRSILGEDDG